jgi:serine/threonine protein kinase
MTQSSQPDSAKRMRVTPNEERLAALRGAVANGYALVAILGQKPGSGAAYLAREDATGDLVAAIIDGRNVEPGKFSFSVVRELDVSLPGPSSVCPNCGRGIDGWIRLCTCGQDLSGVAPESDADREELEERVRQATAGEYEILGSIAYVTGGGSAYFGQQQDTGDIVAIRVHNDGEFEDGGTRLSLSLTDQLGRLDEKSKSPLSGPVHLTPAQAFNVIPDEERRSRPSDPSSEPVDEHQLLRRSGLGSGLMAKLPTPLPEEQVAVAKMCPTCGTEYETGSRFCPSDGTPLRPKGNADPLVGRVLADRYHILKKLGEGGMGRVYLGEHVKMNRQCAIKVMSAQLVNDSESAQRFAREASSSARIIHPNVAAVFDYGESEGLVYIVMEYIDGESLSRILEHERVIAPHRALDIARQVADGLGAAHELGIIHRDLKPDNIIVGTSRSGREVAKVVDFGIAKALQDAPSEALTRTGLVIGTPEYMSPEQLLGDPVDVRSDLYSLGCILYQMLTGAPAFDASTREQMITRRLTEDPPHVRTLVPELPESLDRVVHRMLARNSSNRYPNAADVHDALTPANALGDTWDPSFKPTPRSAPTIVMNAAGTTEKLAANSGVTRRRRNVRRLAAGVFAVAILSTGLTVANVNARRAERQRADSLAAARLDSTQRRATLLADSSVRADSVNGVASHKAANGSRTLALGASRLASRAVAPKPAAPLDSAEIQRLRRQEADNRENADIRRRLSEFARQYVLRDSAQLVGYMEKEIVARLMQMPKLDYEGLQTKVSKSVISGSEADVDFTVQYKNKSSGSGPAVQTTITTLPFQAHLERTTVEWRLRTVKPTGP